MEELFETVFWSYESLALDFRGVWLLHQYHLPYGPLFVFKELHVVVNQVLPYYFELVLSEDHLPAGFHAEETLDLRMFLFNGHVLVVVRLRRSHKPNIELFLDQSSD